ncbi:hypothetical protein ACL02R_25680 [Streptomyces sp. MS19]|uniref:hypothetical protein n=1 Tax=Streptomyces sp. MS19 TaxID=3385972 RepID=UPI0039A28EA7
MPPAGSRGRHHAHRTAAAPGFGTVLVARALVGVTTGGPPVGRRACGCPAGASAAAPYAVEASSVA